MSYTDQPVGLLADVIARVYRYMDEPIDTPKWTSDYLWPLIVGGWQRLMGDINGVGSNRIKIQFTTTITSTVGRYILPPNVGKILRMGYLDSTTGRLTETITPRHELGIYGPGVSLQGNTQLFEPLQYDQTLTMEYVPNGFCSLHTGTLDASASGVSSTTLVLDSEPDEGYFDRQPNAYLGSIIRVLASVEGSFPDDYGHFPVQERIITGWDPKTLIATVDPAFDPDFADLGLVTYEVVPFFGYSAREALAWHVVAKLSTAQKDYTKAQQANLQYQIEKRTLLQQFIEVNSRTGGMWYGDIPGNGTFRTI